MRTAIALAARQANGVAQGLEDAVDELGFLPYPLHGHPSQKSELALEPASQSPAIATKKVETVS